MREWKEYKKIVFDGSMLIPTFSIYLFEIETGEERYFYVGMTGDHHYPSARSAIHRLSGHFELIKNSNQNQIKVGISERNIDFENAKITMHHWPIIGLEKWTGSESLKHFDPIKLEDTDKEKYQAYKSRRALIHQLEVYLIIYTKDSAKERCLNKKAKANAGYDPEFQNIVDQIKQIIQ